MAHFRGHFGTRKGVPAKACCGSGPSEWESAFHSRRNFMQWMASASAGALLSFPGRISGAAPFMRNVSGSQQTLKSIKIARFETFKVVVPMKPGSVLSPDAADLEPFWHDFQKGNPEAPKFIIKLFSDDGLVGIGETQRGVEGAAVSKNGNFLVGQNLWSLTSLIPP